jgi:hypothetical protein
MGQEKSEGKRKSVSDNDRCSRMLNTCAPYPPSPPPALTQSEITVRVFRLTILRLNLRVLSLRVCSPRPGGH